jgi:hypothetical protein
MQKKKQDFRCDQTQLEATTLRRVIQYLKIILTRNKTHFI